MTSIFVPTGNSEIIATTNNEYYLATTTFLLVDSDDGIHGGTNQTGITVVVDGTIAATDDGIDLSGDSGGHGGHNVLIGLTGIVRNLQPNETAGVKLGGKDNVFDNLGQVSGEVGAAFLEADIFQASNQGLISGSSNFGVVIDQSADFDLVNTGTIAGYGGIKIYESDGDIVNFGKIISRTRDDPTIDAFGNTEGLDVFNAGEISVDITGGTAISGTIARDVINNSGLIVGNTILGNDDDDVFNSGLIDGFVYLDADDDEYHGQAGQITGTVDGGSGEDELIGGASSERFMGGADNDLLKGNGGDDFLVGNGGNDVIRGGTGDDYLAGASGNNTLIGGAGDDEIDGSSGNELIRGGSGDDVIEGDSGTNAIFGGSGEDDITGGDGVDTINGGSGEDTIVGGDGNDLIRGGSDSDSVIGGLGADMLFGNQGEDSLVGSDGADQIKGGADDDSLFGGEHNDELSGNSGDDRLFGGDGNDVLIGGRGDDQLIGGAGKDRFVFNRDAGNDTIKGYKNGQDKIDLSAFGFAGKDFKFEVLDAISKAGGKAVFIDLDALGGDGSMLVQGLKIGQVDKADFIL